MRNNQPLSFLYPEAVYSRCKLPFNNLPQDDDKTKLKFAFDLSVGIGKCEKLLPFRFPIKIQEWQIENGEGVAMYKKRIALLIIRKNYWFGQFSLFVARESCRNLRNFEINRIDEAVWYVNHETISLITIKQCIRFPSLFIAGWVYAASIYFTSKCLP